MPLPRGMMGRRRLLPCSLLAPPEKIERERRIARIGGTGSKRVARKTERNIPPIARDREKFYDDGNLKDSRLLHFHDFSNILSIIMYALRKGCRRVL